MFFLEELEKPQKQDYNSTIYCNKRRKSSQIRLLHDGCKPAAP